MIIAIYLATLLLCVNLPSEKLKKKQVVVDAFLLYFSYK